MIKKVCNIEVKISKEILIKIREIIKDRNNDTIISIIKDIEKYFPQFKMTSLYSYIRCCRISDYLFNLYIDNKISFSILTELAVSKFNNATKDFIAKEVIEHKLIISRIRKLKHLIRDGYSIADALNMVIDGDQPKINNTSSKRTNDLLNDIIQLGNDFRLKVELAKDLLPLSTADKNDTGFVIFMKAYSLRHTVKEMMNYLDHKVKKYIDEIEEKARVECDFDFMSSGGKNGNAKAEEIEKEHIS